MAWRGLTRNDIKAKLSGGELEAIEAQLEATGDVQLADLMEQTTNRVRGFIAAYSGNILGPGGTLPERLVSDAVAYMIPELYGHSAGLLIDLSETRKLAAERAEKLFRDVSRGFYAIETPAIMPETPEDTPKASVELISSNPSQLTRNEMKGL